MLGEYRFFNFKRRPKHAGALLVSTAFTLLAACYSPNLSLTDCTVPCVQECPSGSECRNNYCARVESTATCAESGSSGGGAMSGGPSGGGGNSSGTTSAFGGAESMPTAGMGGGDDAGAAGAAGAGPFDVKVSEIAALCPGQSYQIHLTALGGASPYVWILPNGNPTASVLSSHTGDAVDVSGFATKTQPTLQVTTQDAHGGSVTTDIALAVDLVGPGECPQITPTRLPDPCEENPYHAANITVTGGSAPFVWEALSMPEGLAFVPSAQIVGGTALSTGETTPLTLRVTDNKGRQTQMTYPLAYRNRCWFGFTSTAGNSKLHLFDPVLAAYAPPLETSANNAAVDDFKFSPDGKFVVYRHSSGSPSAHSLVLAEAPNWQEQALDFDGSVLSYSWSQSSAVLAVAFQNDTDTLLGGVNVANATVSTGGGSGITGIQALTPVVMLDPASAPLNSELLWFQGDTYLAFHADGLPGFDLGADSPYYAHFDGPGFSAVTEMGSTLYDPAVQLLPAHNGIFAVGPDPAQPQLDFWGSPGGTDSDQYLRSALTSAAADPAGLYVALPMQNKLQIYLTAESGGQVDFPTAWQPSADDCNSILAWDASRERIICDSRGTPSDGGNEEGQVRIFDLAGTAAIPQLTSTALKGLSGYQQGQSLAHRRSFSTTGNWLAFSTDAGLFIANVQEAPQVQQQVPLPFGALGTSPSELAFSPDETLLVWQLGGNLGVIPLQKNGNPGWYGTDLPLLTPDPCNEEFTAGPNKWCGRLEKAGALAWSPDSHFAVVKTAANGLRLFDLSGYIQIGQAPYVDACDTGCPGDFAFQP